MVVDSTVKQPLCSDLSVTGSTTNAKKKVCEHSWHIGGIETEGEVVLLVLLELLSSSLAFTSSSLYSADALLLLVVSVVLVATNRPS
jgi:hypothetical protein